MVTPVEEEEDETDERALAASMMKIVEAMSRVRSREKQYHQIQREREADEVNSSVGCSGLATMEAHNEAEALRRCDDEDATLNMQYLFNGGVRQGWKVVDGEVVTVEHQIQADINLEPPEGYICPHIPASTERVRRVAKYASLSRDDIVYDLGCGDGRFVFASGPVTAYCRLFCRLLFELHAACECQGVGVDINRPLLDQARAEAVALGCAESLRFHMADMLLFAEDLSGASVCVLYLVPVALQLLLPLFQKEWLRRPDFRVVTMVYQIEGLVPVESDADWKLFTYTGAAEVV